MLTFTCFDSHNTNPLTYFDRYTCLQDCYRTRESKKVGSSVILHSTFVVHTSTYQLMKLKNELKSTIYDYCKVMVK